VEKRKKKGREEFILKTDGGYPRVVWGKIPQIKKRIFFCVF
jgi:hypothetical protein